MEYIIGVDGGGTKTEVVAYDLSGKELYRTQGGYGNLSVNIQEALNNIVTTIGECVAKLKEDKCLFIALGLAGIESGKNKEIVTEKLKECFNVEVEAMNDADIALAALLKGEDGILTIAGTGSICYGISNNNKARAGGWGHLIGDEGSGYYISMAAIKHMSRRDDEGFSLDFISKSILSQLSLSTAQDIKGFVYSKSKADIASLATVVVNCAEAGDNIAIDILQQAGRDLAITTWEVCKKLELDEGVNIGIVGSVLKKCNIVSEAFEEELSKRLQSFNIVREDTSPAMGAYYIYHKKKSTKINIEVFLIRYIMFL